MQVAGSCALVDGLVGAGGTIGTRVEVVGCLEPLVPGDTPRAGRDCKETAQAQDA